MSGSETAASGPAEAMNRMYRGQRHIYDLTRRYYLLGRDPMLRGLRAAPGARVLEIGCGTGRNLVRAAALYPQARMFGFDVSTEMLASARASVARAGLTGRVRLAQANAIGFTPSALGEQAFDRIFISYCLSMIPAWRRVMDDAVNALAPGGELHVVDFGGQDHLPKWFGTALRAWLAQFHVTPRLDLDDAVRSAALRCGGTMTFARPYRGYAQHAIVTRPLTDAA